MIDNLGLSAAREAAEKRKELGIKIQVLSPIQRAAKNPTSLRCAINGKCYDCQGAGYDPGTKERIRDCEAYDCTLHPVRPYQNIRRRVKECSDLSEE